MYNWDQNKARLLAEVLIEKHQDWNRIEILQDFLVSRGLGWKWAAQSEPTSGIPVTDDLLDDLYRFFVKSDPVIALVQLLLPAHLVNWANSIVGDEAFYSEISDRVDMAKTILAAYELPLRPEHALPYSLDTFRDGLVDIKDQLMQYEKDGDVPNGVLRGLVLDGWSEFETLLRLTLIFWKHALEQVYAHDWLRDAIDGALAQRSLGALVERGFKSLKQFLDFGVPQRLVKQRDAAQREQEREIRKQYSETARLRRNVELQRWGEGTRVARQALLADPEYVSGDSEVRSRMMSEFKDRQDKGRIDLERRIADVSRAELEAELRQFEKDCERQRREDEENGKRLIELYQSACHSRLGQLMPFDLEALRHTIDEIGFRNLYAHEDSTALYEKGVSHAIDAIDALLKVGDALVRESMCPSLVIIVGTGRDILGRELALFLAEKDALGREEFRPTRVRWVFKSHDDLRPYKPYYIVSKHHFRDVEPFMVDADTLLIELDQHKSALSLHDSSQ